jgi:hypothetical protein
MRNFQLKTLLFIMLILAFLAAGEFSAMAQDTNPPSLPESAGIDATKENAITAVPNRPTFSTTAETVQMGIFEIEYGLEAAWGHQNINGLLKFGLTRNLELRFANLPFERDAGIAGLGDSAAGLKYRLFEETGAWPTIAFLYGATLPSADAGLGADGVGHAAGVLLSKDFGKHHVDYNEIVEWRSRPHSAGFNRDYFTALAYSRLLTKKLGIAVEAAGYSRVNAETPSTFTILQALTYSPSSRLVLDSGFYFAVHGDLPTATFFAGVTYSVADLYRVLRPAHR